MNDILAVSGRIKSLEKIFLSPEKLAHLAQTGTFREFAETLSGTWYGFPGNPGDPGELAAVLENVETLLLKDMRQSLPSWIYSYFILPHDYVNIRRLASGAGSEDEEGFSRHASVPFFVLKGALESKNYKDVPHRLKKPLSLAAAGREGNLTAELHRCYFQTAAGLLASAGSRFIDDYMSIAIDFANMSAFLHNQFSGKEDTGLFIGGGNIREGRFAGSEESLWKYVNTEYRKVVTPVTADNYDMQRCIALMDHIKTGRVAPYGIDTVFAYFAAREIELQNVRRLALGKFYGIPAATLETWLLPAYR